MTCSVYVLVGGYDYEGSAPVLVFKTKEAAQQMMAVAEAYGKAPRYIDPNRDAWEAGHPLGDAGRDYDYYDIEEVAFHDA